MTTWKALGLWKEIMRKLLLLDADVIIDLHTLGLFGKIRKAYDICLTRAVFEEAIYYKKGGKKIDINIKNASIIDDVDLESLRKVQREAKEARLLNPLLIIKLQIFSISLPLDFYEFSCKITP